MLDGLVFLEGSHYLRIEEMKLEVVGSTFTIISVAGAATSLVQEERVVNEAAQFEVFLRVAGLQA